MAYVLSQSSKDKLKGVHPDLQKVVMRALALSEVDFKVIEGLRTKERQAYLFKTGKTKTMNSRHLTGHAVDLVPLPIDWNNKKPFELLANAMRQASQELNIPIRWGGDWNRNGNSRDEKFYDGPHFELLRPVYPNKGDK